MLHLVSVRRADEKFYRIEVTPTAGGTAVYEIVECVPGYTPRRMCASALRDDARLIANALNNHGSKQDE